LVASFKELAYHSCRASSLEFIIYAIAMSIKSLLKKLPNSPGVYKFKDEEGRILYVGKAKNLRKRVQSYFRKQKGRSVRTEKLIEKTVDAEWTEVESDLEAIVLESNLIKELRPRYNVLMKDDKNFVYIKISKDEDFPRVKIVRKVEKDGARYFGPKTSANQVKKTLLLLQKLFKYRSCDLGIKWISLGKSLKGQAKITKKTIAYPCLDFHIKRCDAPCTANVTPEEYGEGILQIERFLEGKTEEIEAALNLQMEECVAAKQFERAALLRDKLLAVKELSQRQVVSSPDHASMDVFGFVIDGQRAYFNLFMFRDGKLINQENFVADSGGFAEGEEAQAGELMESFLFQYYEKAADVPRQVLVPVEIVGSDFLKDFLAGLGGGARGAGAKLLIPQRGKKNKIIELAQKNAVSFMKQHKAKWEKADANEQEALLDLQQILKLEKAPRRIEAYDISHLSGTDTVASMVVFEKGVPKKSDYRKFRLKTLAEHEIDDYKAMKEVLGRRFARLRKDVSIRKGTKGKKVAAEKLLGEHWKDTKIECDMGQYYLAYAGKDGKELVGAIRMKPETEPGGIYVALSLYVKPKFRERGVAKALMRHSIAKTKAKRVYLFCGKDMAGFYKDFGFQEIKKVPESFEDEWKQCERQCGAGKSLAFAYNPSKHKDASFAARPDLVLIDGGKGQLSTAVKVMKTYNLDVPVISIAKRQEEVFIPGQKTSLMIPQDAKALYLLRRVRDEAHRFAITFQKERRKKGMFK